MAPLFDIILGVMLVTVSGALIIRFTGYYFVASPAGIFYGLFVAFIYVGTVLISNGISLPYARPVSGHPVFLGLAILAFSVGVSITSLFASLEPFSESLRYSRSDMRQVLDGNFPTYIAGASILLLGYVGAKFVQLGSPLLSSMPYREWAASMSLGMLTIGLFLPSLFLLVLAYGYVSKKSWLWSLGIVGLGLTVVFMILTSRRYPVLDLGIWVVSLYLYHSHRSPRDLSKIFASSALLAFPFFVGIQIIRNPVSASVDSVFVTGWRYFRNRIFLSEATGVNFILESFPEHQSFYGGRALLEQVVSILPGFNATVSLGDQLFESVLAGSGGYLPPTFIGELYAYVGVFSLVLLCVWGMILQTVFVLFLRIKKTPLTIVLFAITSGLLGRSLIQGFLTPTNRIKYLTLLLLPLCVIALKLPEIRIRIQDTQ